jgi:hypothetical protein
MPANRDQSHHQIERDRLADELGCEQSGRESTSCLLQLETKVGGLPVLTAS